MKTSGIKILGMTIVAVIMSFGQSRTPSLKMEEMMTAQELHDSGVSGLSPKQREALDRWLLRYTKLVIVQVQSSETQALTPPPTRPVASKCTPAVESTILGEFSGWEGETIFKLDNGQIWEQAEYDYMYSYQYRPDVTIYAVSSGCRMKVADEDETILVRRIK